MIDKKIFATKHCVDRYREYCHDVKDHDELIKNLIVRFRKGTIVETAPIWVEAKRPNQKYLLVGSNLVFPLVYEKDAYVAITCLHRQYAEKRTATKLLEF